MRETYVSTDIETDGPIPGPHSLLSLGSAAYRSNGKLLGTFTINLETLPGASGDPRTMQWWDGQPEAWEAARRDPRPPEEAMQAYAQWVDGLPGKPVFAAYPAGFDFLFVYWYLIRFVGRSPFSFSALDMKSYAMALLDKPFRQCTKGNFPRHWLPPKRHSHVALDDAQEQGEMLLAMFRDRRERKKG